VSVSRLTVGVDCRNRAAKPNSGTRAGVQGRQRNRGESYGDELAERGEDHAHRSALRENKKRGAVRPAASITARMSSLRSSRVGAPATRSDRPVPRLSKTSTRACSATPHSNTAQPAESHCSSTWETQPGAMTTSNGALAHHLIGDHEIPAARIGQCHPSSQCARIRIRKSESAGCPGCPPQSGAVRSVCEKL